MLLMTNKDKQILQLPIPYVEADERESAKE